MTDSEFKECVSILKSMIEAEIEGFKNGGGPQPHHEIATKILRLYIDYVISCRKDD